jgi:hypothetical protein
MQCLCIPCLHEKPLDYSKDSTVPKMDADNVVGHTTRMDSYRVAKPQKSVIFDAATQTLSEHNGTNPHRDHWDIQSHTLSRISMRVWMCLTLTIDLRDSDRYLVRTNAAMTLFLSIGVWL